ncbi:MAG: thiamine diphosphokinase [Dehalococcoidales bacterium]|nr:thiamine diphosphokinase [Dehalococcoidales bacterium]
MNVLVLVNGELYKPDILLRRISSVEFDLVIGVDAGTNHAKTLGIDVDVIIGDMDSLTDDEMISKNTPERISYPAEKDEIDLELALHYALDIGADRIVMAGTMGGRIEMSIANILLVTHSRFRTHRIEIWHGEQTAWLIRPPGGNFPGVPGDTISLVPLGGTASGITLTGMKYPLHNAVLATGIPRGISNIIENQPARVDFSDGLLLAVHTPEEEG